MKTAEEFTREYRDERKPHLKGKSLSQTICTYEEALRMAHEFASSSLEELGKENAELKIWKEEALIQSKKWYSIWRFAQSDKSFTVGDDIPETVLSKLKTISEQAEEIKLLNGLLTRLEKEMEILNNLNNAQKEYELLLLDEIDSLVPIAHIHGWRSQNHEKGKACREKIRNILRKQRIDGIQSKYDALNDGIII